MGRECSTHMRDDQYTSNPKEVCALQAVSCSAVEEPSLGGGGGGEMYSAVSLKLLILYFQRNCEFCLGGKMFVLATNLFT